MGFAAIENVLYLFRTESNLVMTMGISRGLLAIPAHAMCAIFMGYYYGNAKYVKSYGDRSKCRKYLITGFITASSLHAFYDFCLMTGRMIFVILFIVFVIVADIFTIIRIVKAKKEDQKMYEAPQYRQYWVASNPYQAYGGYQAPSYGGYAQPNQMGMQMSPEQGTAAYGTADFGAAYSSAGLSGVQPQYGAAGVPESQPQYGAAGMPGAEPQYGAGMPGAQPGYGTQNIPPQAGQQYGMPVIKDLYVSDAPQKQQLTRNNEVDKNMLIHCPVCNEICSFHAFYCSNCGSAIHQLRDGYSQNG
jgi:hypothetical protein